jgi:hypothetical protein
MVNKLIALAEIYSIPIDQLLRSNDGGNADTLILARLSSPNETLLLAEDPQEPETTPFSHHFLFNPPVRPRCSRQRMDSPARHIGGLSSPDLI